MSKFIVKSAAIMGIATLLSRILGFVRDMVIAYFLGASIKSDAFFVAFRIPNLLRRLFGEGSLTISFIPVFTKYRINKGEDEANIIASISFSILIIILLVITAGGIIFSPIIINIIAPGFKSNFEKFQLAVNLNRIMFPYIFFISLVALCMGILNSLKHFFAPSIAPVFLNLSMIFSCILGYFLKGEIVYFLAWGVFFGGLIQLMLQLIFLKKFNIKIKPCFKINHPAIKEILYLMGPSILGLAVTQIQIFFNTLLASFLESGSISYLYYSDRLIQFPLGVFAVSIGNAVLPLISEYRTKGQYEKISESYIFSIKLIFLISLPAMIGLITAGKLILAVLFKRGLFTNYTLNKVYKALLAYALGLWAYSGIRILTPIYYAYEDTKTPVKIAFLALIVNISSSLIFMKYFSYTGLALATFISSSINFILLGYFIKRYVDVDYFSQFIYIIKIIFASSIMGFFIFSFLNFFPYQELSSIMQAFYLLFLIIVSFLIYLILCYFFKIHEIKFIIKRFIK